MIVVTANWEIGDGSLWPGAAAGMMGRFRAEVTRAAVRAGWQVDGGYAPVPRVDVVFAGDTFDWLGSCQWLGTSRPWHRNAKAREIRQRVVAASLRAGHGVVRGMLAMVRRGVHVPVADRHGRPVPGATERVPLGLSIVEGDLDAGLSRDVARTSVERLGIGVGTAWEARGVRVVHGHDVDPLWDAEGVPSGAPTLGESLRIDLLGRFAASTAVSAIDPETRRSFLANLRAAHPLVLANVVTAWGVACRDAAVACRLRDDWLRSVSGWHRAARGAGLPAAGPWQDAPFDVVDALAARLAAVSRRAMAGRPSRVSGDLLAELLGGSAPLAACRRGEGILVLGHAPVDAVVPAGAGRVVGLGARRSVEDDGDGPLPGVREISLLPSTPPFPVTAVITDRGGRGAAVSSLGEPVAEWSDGGRRRVRAAAPADAGAWIVEAA